MRALPAVVLLIALAGCLGSGGGPIDDPGPQPAKACVAEGASASDQGPGLPQRAAASTTEGGQRTLRWDLVVSLACQEPASAQVQLVLAAPPQGCPPQEVAASVTTGLSERAVPLEDGVGSLAFTPARVDGASGPASFVLSLSATAASDGSAPRDDSCLDATLDSFTLAASFTRPA